MAEKIKQWFTKLRYNWSHERCYTNMEYAGRAAMGCCGGLVGGDKSTGYLQYACIGCPHYVETVCDEYSHIGRGGIAHKQCREKCATGMTCATCSLEEDMLKRLAAYEDLGPVEELAALKERMADVRLQLRTATFSTDKGTADLAKFILSLLPEAPKDDANG